MKSVSVPIELLERITRPQLKPRDETVRRRAITELRALLDKQAECRCKRYGKDNPHWPCPVHAEPAAQHQGVPPLIATLHENGELIAAQATIAQQAKLIELLKGKGKGQGEPVAYTTVGMLEIAKRLPLTGRIGAKSTKDERWNIPLFLGQAEQLAPVADGTTSNKYKAELYDEVWQKARDMGFANVSDALAEVARLNGVKP